MNMSEESNKINFVLPTAAVVSCVILVIAAVNRENNKYQGLFISMICLSVTFGLFSIAGLLETKIKPLLGFVSFRWVFVSALALVAYISRVDAVNDINEVFHIDAGALPLTTIAVTVMRFATYMFWPMVVVVVTSALVIGFMFFGSVLDDKEDIVKVVLGVWAWAAFASSGLACLLICGQLSDVGIKAKLYRVAHKSDFVGNFNCQGIDSKRFAALFIGPEQRRVLLAEKIPNDTWIFNEKVQQPELMRPVSIPAFFPIMDCSPSFPSSAP